MPVAAAIDGVAEIANTLINQAFAEKNRKRNFYWNEKAADAADQRQRNQYHDLYSPQAMMNQYAAAGLSPSMMMSGSAPAVGQSSAQGNMSGGLQGPYPEGKIFDPLAAAQIANVWANTKKTEAETLNISADTQFTLTNIIKASAETENIKLTKKLIKLQTTGQDLQNEAQKLQNEITSENKDEIIRQCSILSEKLQRESNQIFKQNEGLDIENNLSRETYQTRVKQYLADYEQTIKITAKAASDIELNDQQIQTLIDRVANEQFDARTRRISANEQIRQNDEIVKQWAIENGFRKNEISNERWSIAMKTITNIIDSAAKVAGAVIAAK